MALFKFLKDFTTYCAIIDRSPEERKPALFVALESWLRLTDAERACVYECLPSQWKTAYTVWCEANEDKLRQLNQLRNMIGNSYNN